MHLRITLATFDQAHLTELLEAPVEQCCEIAVAPLARRPTEKNGVQLHAVATRKHDLAPTGAACVARLDSSNPGVAPQQIVRGVERAAARQRDGLESHDAAKICVLHRPPGKCHHIARARKVFVNVQPVWALEVRVGEAHLARLAVHQAHETASAVLSANVIGERVRRVVGALDQHGLEQLLYGQALAGL